MVIWQITLFAFSPAACRCQGADDESEMWPECTLAAETVASDATDAARRSFWNSLISLGFSRILDVV